MDLNLICTCNYYLEQKKMNVYKSQGSEDGHLAVSLALTLVASPWCPPFFEIYKKLFLCWSTSKLHRKTYKWISLWTQARVLWTHGKPTSQSIMCFGWFLLMFIQKMTIHGQGRRDSTHYRSIDIVNNCKSFSLLNQNLMKTIYQIFIKYLTPPNSKQKKARVKTRMLQINVQSFPSLY